MTTYIYAGLALVIIVGALGYFGAYNPSSYAKEACESGEQISCADALVTADGKINVMVTNNLERTIIITNYTIFYGNEAYRTPDANIVASPHENITLTAQTDRTFKADKKEKIGYTFDYRPQDSELSLSVSGTATSIVDEPVKQDCGNHILEGTEQCEVGDSISCKAFFTTYDHSIDLTTHSVTGTLSCNTATCTYNPEGCTITTMNPDHCGDGIIDPILGETCDPNGDANTCPGSICNPDTCTCTTPNIIDCGTDSQANTCFINAAQDCMPAKMTVRASMSFYGIETTSTTYREIQGLHGDKCPLYQRIDAYDSTYSDELQQQLLASGTTQEELDTQMQEQDQQDQDMIGKDGTCKYPIPDLVAMLQAESQGHYSFSTSDSTMYQCTGTLYETSTIA